MFATGGPPPTYGSQQQAPDSRHAAPLTGTGGYQAMTPMPASVERVSGNPRSAPSMPQGASPVPGAPISSNQPAGTSTGAGFSHTSAGFPSADRPKNQKAILITAAVAFTVVVGTLTVILVGSGSQPDAGAPAASPEKPIQAATPPAPSAAPSVIPAPPAPAEVAAPTPTAEPEAPAPTAAGAATSKPKTSDTGAAKTSRPPPKTTKPNVVYSPD
jgi:hypothetical protein